MFIFMDDGRRARTHNVDGDDDDMSWRCRSMVQSVFGFHTHEYADVALKANTCIRCVCVDIMLLADRLTKNQWHHQQIIVFMRLVACLLSISQFETHWLQVYATQINS